MSTHIFDPRLSSSRHSYCFDLQTRIISVFDKISMHIFNIHMHPMLKFLIFMFKDPKITRVPKIGQVNIQNNSWTENNEK